MSRFSFSHLSDAAVLRQAPVVAGRRRAATAELLGLLVEIAGRKLYLPAGYPSLRAYCLDVLRLSEDGAKKLIRAALLAVRFPVIAEFIEDGRLT